MLDNNDRTYKIWDEMMERCGIERNSDAAQSESECDEFTLEAFLEYLEEEPPAGPNDHYVLECICPEFGYIPSNCMWVIERGTD